MTDVKPQYRSMGIKLLQLKIFAVSYLFLHLAKNPKCCNIRYFSIVYWWYTEGITNKQYLTFITLHVDTYFHHKSHMMETQPLCSVVPSYYKKVII